MTPRAAFLKWTLLGGLVAGMLLIGQAIALDGPAGLLQVGAESNLRPLIEEELGEIPLAPRSGHDGQIYYAIGLDLSAKEVPPLLDHGAYRYRRIAYPAIASIFGLLDGEALLYGMIATAVLAAAVASGLAAAMAVRASKSDWLALAVVANPGIWLSVRLLTADIVAIALMLTGLWCLTASSRWRASFAFALSAMAKDVFLATPGSLGLERPRARWPIVVIPTLSLVAWMTWLTIRMGEGFSGRGNVTWPLAGLIEASGVWGEQSAADTFYLAFALASVATGLVFATVRRTWLRWPILTWSLLGFVSSGWVWDIGNNAARVFAPIAILVALAFTKPDAARTRPT